MTNETAARFLLGDSAVVIILLWFPVVETKKTFFTICHLQYLVGGLYKVMILWVRGDNEKSD